MWGLWHGICRSQAQTGTYKGDSGVTLGEGVLLLIRWCHAIAAVTWVGGTLFYLLVLRPRSSDAEPRVPALSAEAMARFRSVAYQMYSGWLPAERHEVGKGGAVN